VRDEIKKRHPEIKVICVVQDASVKVDWAGFMDQLKDLHITVLINNLGTPSPIPYNAIEAATDEQIESVIRVNTIFPAQLTRNLVPTLIKNSPSLILTMCSASTYTPCGFLGIYAGSKAFDLTWSKALYNEMGLLKRNVDCKAVMTGVVSTHGHSVPTSAFIPSAEVYAKSMLARAGSSGPVYCGWWRHWWQVRFIGCSC